MKPSDRIKSIRYLKAHTSEMIGGLAEHGEALLITVHGKSKAVLQDIDAYEWTQETLALLKILSLSAQDVAAVRACAVKRTHA